MPRNVKYCGAKVGKDDYRHYSHCRRLYIRNPLDNYKFVAIGWICPKCGWIKLDENNVYIHGNVYNNQAVELLYTKDGPVIVNNETT